MQICNTGYSISCYRTRTYSYSNGIIPLFTLTYSYYYTMNHSKCVSHSNNGPPKGEPGQRKPGNYVITEGICLEESKNAITAHGKSNVWLSCMEEITFSKSRDLLPWKLPTSCFDWSICYQRYWKNEEHYQVMQHDNLFP